MRFLSARPMQARVGGSVVKPPPFTIATPGGCPPYSMYAQYSAGDVLPPCSPTGDKWVLWHGDKTAAASGGAAFWDLASGGPARGLDKAGRWWFYSGGESSAISGGRFTDNNSPVPRHLLGVLQSDKPAPSPFGSGYSPDVGSWTIYVKPTGGSFARSLLKAMSDYVIPAMTVAIGTLVPGAGGIVFAAAFTAVSQISEGIAVKQALIGATRNSLPSLLRASEFDKAIKLGESKVPSSVVNAAKAALPTPQQRTAFDAGLILVDSKNAQASAVAALKAAIPSEATKIQYAFDNGATVEDLADVYGGDKGIALMTKAIDSSPKYSDSTVAGGGSGKASSGKGGSGEGSGIGLGTVVLVGGLGYAGYKYGPKIWNALRGTRQK